jgi:hypothetical protein
MKYPDDCTDFYKSLPAFYGEVSDLMVRKELFKPVPKSWHVIITDIKNSTNAVLEGKHDIVNYLATGSIVTVLNVAHKYRVEIPFFFGGDGATFLVPGSLLDEIMDSLCNYSENAQATSGLELRVGTVSVAAIMEKGHRLEMAKFSSSDAFIIPIIIGEGLIYAEIVVKATSFDNKFKSKTGSTPDLSGMQCRWDQIPPPKKHEEVITLLIVSRDPDLQRISFRRIIDAIDRIYGSPDERQPISVAKLRLKTTFKCVRLERKLFVRNARILNFLGSLADKISTIFFFKTRAGKKYLKSLVARSDTFVIDGRINTVISGTKKQRRRLEVLLNSMEAQGLIWFGLYISSSSVMSCYVRNLENGHIHFVDGADGGYTNAAGSIKNKMHS